MKPELSGYFEQSGGLSHYWCRIYINELISLGLEQFYISPGSRSTPLTLAAVEHPAARCSLVYDERSAAYTALGHARYTDKPAALICTSGTAAANYFPALLEAAQDGVAMLVLGADRPPELQDSRANQTLRQDHLYGRYVNYHTTIPCADESIETAWLQSSALTAWQNCLWPQAGPVHINFQFREPLVPDSTKNTYRAVKAPLQRWQAPAAAAFDPASLPPGRPFILAGRLDHTTSAGIKTALEAVDSGSAPFLLLPDILSGLRQFEHPLVVNHASMMASRLVDNLKQPDYLIHLGGPFTGKALPGLLAGLDVPVVSLDVNTGRRNEFNRRGLHLQTDDLAAAFAALTLHLQNNSPNAASVVSTAFEASRKINRAINEAFDKTETLNENSAIYTVARHWNQILFCGNSMPIRTLEAFSVTGQATPQIFANRGISGIEGNLATASGLAAASEQSVLALLGDISLHHDLSSLELAARLKLTVVLINNGGGGIFHHLPVSKHRHFEEWFATPHRRSFKGSAGDFGLEYHTPESTASLARLLNETPKTGRLIEIICDRQQNVDEFKKIRAGLETAWSVKNTT